MTTFVSSKSIRRVGRTGSTERITHKDDTNVRCDVFQVALEDIQTNGRPFYATLSYAWGDTKPANSIRCGPDFVRVTRNLYEAMIYIRHLRYPRLLWIDSLSINQTNEREKRQQVQRMALIYGQSHCISWLGMEFEDCDDLKELSPLLLWFSEFGRSVRQQQALPTPHTLNQFFQWHPAPGCESLLDIPWEALHRSLDREVFRRLWCVQEMCLARSNDVRTSETHMDIHVLHGVGITLEYLLSNTLPARTSTHRLFEPSVYPAIFKLIEACRRINNTLAAGPRVSFLKGTQRHLDDRNMAAITAMGCFGKECTDPRDHIYGLAALCGFNDSNWITRSTSLMTAQEVFVDFTLHCLRTSKSLFLFGAPCRVSALRDKSHVHSHFQHRSWLSGLPSWCPDFAGPRAYLRTLTYGDRWRATPMRSCRGRPARFTTLTRRQIGALGFRIGVVQICSSTWYSTQDDDDDPVWWKDMEERATPFERCAVLVQDIVPAHRFWQLYLDVCAAGADLRYSPAWRSVAKMLPQRTKDRMVKKTVGAAWLINYAPDLAHKAGLLLNRKLDPESWRSVAEDLDVWLKGKSSGTRLFTTDNAFAILGTGPEGLHVGDVVVVLFGGNTPYVLRGVGNQGHYKLIGECYVSGIMHGEALDMGLEEQEFVII